MKRTFTLALALLLTLAALTGCGKKAEGSADLTAFYDSLAQEYGWDTGMMDIEGDLLESAYPGLGAIPAKQLVAKMPAMSAAVCEMVFMECESAGDAEKAAEIFRARVAQQADGGAWYPDSMAAWGEAQVVTQGSWAAMIAVAGEETAIRDAFLAALG